MSTLRKNAVWADTAGGSPCPEGAASPDRGFREDRRGSWHPAQCLAQSRCTKLSLREGTSPSGWRGPPRGLGHRPTREEAERLPNWGSSEHPSKRLLRGKGCLLQGHDRELPGDQKEQLSLPLSPGSKVTLRNSVRTQVSGGQTGEAGTRSVGHMDVRVPPVTLYCSLGTPGEGHNTLSTLFTETTGNHNGLSKNFRSTLLHPAILWHFTNEQTPSSQGGIKIHEVKPPAGRCWPRLAGAQGPRTTGTQRVRPLPVSPRAGRTPGTRCRPDTSRFSGSRWKAESRSGCGLSVNCRLQLSITVMCLFSGGGNTFIA